jgi:hypothetical protein
VPRLSARLLGGQEGWPLGVEAWGDTRIDIPRRLHLPEAGPLRNAFTDEAIALARDEEGTHLPAASVFASFPVALLRLEHQGLT